MDNRCPWAAQEGQMRDYHDQEWGVPLHDDQKLFEFLILDGFQAGLSWAIILKKRESFRLAFDYFDIQKVAGYAQHKLDSIMSDPGVVRNRNKILAAVKNAQASIRVCEEFGSLDRYLWQFTGGKTIMNTWTTLSEIPPRSAESEAMSRDLLGRGFSFVGPTICYAFMQAAGMVNDHIVGCFRYNEV
jgi:DNA-3-methyladenine glycosylase I